MKTQAVYTATDLRRDVYRILDEVIATGAAVEVTRRGQRLRIALANEQTSSRSKPIMQGLLADDPESYRHIDWDAEWRP